MASNSFSSAKIAFHPNEHVWLCLTTLLHRRFVEDAIHVIGLPRGSPIRLRYRRRYIDPSLWNEISAGRVDSDAVVLIALGVTGSDDRNIVSPLREGRVVSARCEGSVLIIDIQLRSFVYCSAISTSFWDEIQLIAKDLPSAFGTKEGVEGTYLQALSSPPQAVLAGDDIGTWEAVAEAFFCIDNANARKSGNASSCTPFLYHVAQLPGRVGRSLAETGAIEIEAGNSLNLEVHTLAGKKSETFMNPVGEVLFELSHPAASFVSSRRVRVDSRRDVRVISLSSTALFRRVYGHLSVRTVVFSGGKQLISDGSSTGEEARILSAEGRDETVVARYDFPLRIGRMTPWIASTMVATAAALAAYKVPESGHWNIGTLLVPGCTFVLAFIGLALGLRREGRS